MNRRHRLALFIALQLTLLLIESVTRYDEAGRQMALAITNVVASLAVVLFDLKLRRRGSGLSTITLVFVAGAVWLDALGNFQHLYAGFWWWDRLTHTVGGMALSAGFIDLFGALRQSGRMTIGSVVAPWFGFLVGQLVGSLYEISEWLGDLWFATERVRGPFDAPHDLFQNLLGGLLVLLVFLLSQRRTTLAAR